MLNFLKFFLFAFLISETSLLFWFFFDNEVNSHEFFLYNFFFSIYLNFYLNENKNFFRINIDILFKYFLLFFKTPNFFMNYFINLLKKIFFFLRYYKYRNFFNFIKIFFKKYVYNFIVIWRPLFKKTSYFGYYRSNRSKWIK